MLVPLRVSRSGASWSRTSSAVWACRKRDAGGVQVKKFAVLEKW